MPFDLKQFVLTLLYTFTGFAFLFFGYRLFDWLTPGDAQHKIFEEGNVAVAVMKGAFVLAIAIVLAAVIAA